MGLLIKGGEIVTAESRFRGDILVEEETVSRIGANLDAPPGYEVIDATGRLVFPGFIDPHVHVHLPFMATFAKDTHATASIAALVGGTTTFIEMVCPSRGDDALAGYHTWKQKAEGQAACDYAFHMAVTRWDTATESQLREIVRDGTASFKVFLAYKNFFGVTDEETVPHAQAGRRTGRDHHCALRKRRTREPVAATAVGCRQDRTGMARAEPPGGGRGRRHRPLRHVPRADRRGGLRGASLLRPALRAAIEARLRGVRLYVESVLPHFLLDKTYAERPGVEGMKHVMSPPLRDARNLPVLWDALNAGLIDTVGTDHCPFDTSQKLLGDGDFTKIPNGIPGIEDRVNLMHTYGVQRGRIDLHRFVDAPAPAPRNFSGCSRARERSPSVPTPIWSSTIRPIAAQSPRLGSFATTTTAASRVLRSRAGPPWSRSAARYKQGMAFLSASGDVVACCAANRTTSAQE